MEKKNKNKKQERTLEENLQDKVYVNYSILLRLNNLSIHLEEMKKINYAILEIMNALYQKILTGEPPKESEKKEEREGTLASKR